MKHEAQRRGSAFNRELIGEDYPWDLVAQLLAIIADGVHVSNFHLARANAKRPGSIKPPKQIPRPGVTSAEGKRVGGDTVVSLDEARRIFRRHNPSAFAPSEPA